MQTIIRDKTHLTERCEAVLADLSGPLATPLEPTEEELNPPPPPKKEYRLTLGVTVYLGAQEYELLAYNEQTVRLYDPTFPIFNKELPRIRPSAGGEPAERQTASGGGERGTCG